MVERTSLWVAGALLVAACGGEEVVPTPIDPQPETPTILRDVAMVNDDAEFTHPFVPGHRTTMDGRVALRVQGTTPNADPASTSLSFYLFSPERLAEPILPGPAGPEIMADPDPFYVPWPPALEPDIMRMGHTAICDPTTEFPVEGERPNPYPCGADLANDCYDITIIGSTSQGLTSAQMWGTPATVEVANPKTAQARLVSVELGESVKGAIIKTAPDWTEVAVTTDGRLLTGRLGGFPRRWTNPETGEQKLRNYDLAYSVLPEDAAPCDVTGWTDFHPMSHAPFDPQMVGRYGLAAYPFRDTEGNLIADGEDMGGTYPWVDREGANIFMTGVPGRIIEQSPTRFPRRCVQEGCEGYDEPMDWDRGFMVAGLWTHGKLVHLDGLINNVDWALGVSPAAHYLVDLYRDEDAATSVRFGSGRGNASPAPPGYSGNANIMDSLQNLVNHQAAARPVTPRDVVWVMGTGVATDEIAFDDFLDPNAFIVSNMQASITQLLDADGDTTGVPHHRNGQVRELGPGLIFIAEYWLDPEADDDIHLQNAATSLRWNVPAYGFVAAGSARVEPVALGGVKGRGFWLSGGNEVRYAVPAQPRPVDEVPWYIGVFVDPRGRDGAKQTLMSFPDGSSIRLIGRSTVEYRAGGKQVHAVELPAASGWMHLGWRLGAGNTDVTFLLNGYAFDRFEATSPLFEMVEGDFTVGRAGDEGKGFRGWVDDLVVLAHDVDVEVACNHAGGTLVHVQDNASWAEVAGAYPTWAHDEVAQVAQLGPASRSACFVDYSGDYAAHLGNTPAGTSSVRDVILFPEGPLRAGAPRPDSTQNQFCLSCHHSEGRGGLSLDALALNPDVAAEDDLRRQPLQPPRRVFGNIPAGWIPPGAGAGSPDEAVQAPPEGFLIDRWVMP